MISANFSAVFYLISGILDIFRKDYGWLGKEFKFAG